MTRAQLLEQVRALPEREKELFFEELRRELVQQEGFTLTDEMERALDADDESEPCISWQEARDRLWSQRA